MDEDETGRLLNAFFQRQISNGHIHASVMFNGDLLCRIRFFDIDHLSEHKTLIDFFSPQIRFSGSRNYSSHNRSWYGEIRVIILMNQGNLRLNYYFFFFTPQKMKTKGKKFDSYTTIISSENALS